MKINFTNIQSENGLYFVDCLTNENNFLKVNLIQKRISSALQNLSSKKKLPPKNDESLLFVILINFQKYRSTL